MTYIDGNDAQLFFGGDECLQELLRVLDSAQHHIHIQTMAFYNDKTGRQIADLLKNKAQLESVQVRLLTNFPATEFSAPTLKGSPDDATSTPPFPKAGPTLPFYEELRTAGATVINSHPLSHFGTDIEAMENQPLEILVTLLGLPSAVLIKIKKQLMEGYWRKETFDPTLVPPEFALEQNRLDLQHKTTLPLHLDHRKIVVVDGKIALVCTFNIGRDYLYEIPFGPSLHQNFWLDAMTSLRGPVVSVVQKVFAERWMLSGGDVFAPDFVPVATSSFVPVNGAVGGDSVAIVTSGSGDQLANPIRNAMESKLQDVSTRGKPIMVINPYICDDHLVDLLVAAAGHGSQVSVISSDHHLDSPWSRDAGHLRFKRMLNAGISLCEYPGRMLHAKILTVGDDWATIGSYNWNYRSSKRDLECNAFINSATFVTQVGAKAELLKQAAEAVVRPPTATGDTANAYPLGCLDSASYAALPQAVRALIEEADWLTTQFEDLEVL